MYLESLNSKDFSATSPLLLAKLIVICILSFSHPHSLPKNLCFFSIHSDNLYFNDLKIFKLYITTIVCHVKGHLHFSIHHHHFPPTGQKFALMEEKIVLSSIMRNFRVESTTRREDLRILGELILRPENGNVVKLFPRSATVG